MMMIMCVNEESTTTVLFGLSGDRDDFMHLRHTVTNSPSLDFFQYACLVVDIHINV